MGECGGSCGLDICGVCCGGGIVAPYCDCEGNTRDCSGECGGLDELDECDVCNGPGVVAPFCNC